MTVFDHPDFDDHEHVSFFRDPASGLRAIIAIHTSTSFAGSGGGCRMLAYTRDADALRDALRLSKAMSYKLALAGVPSGGAKTVVIGDPATQKTEALLRALGRAVARLGGRYIMGEDVGTTEADMVIVREETPFVMVGHGSTARPTALGAFLGVQVAVEHAVARSDLSGLHVAIQGVGSVGARLAKLLSEAGARITIADVDRAACARLSQATGARVVEPDAIYDVEADVFAPCALGAILNDETVPRLRCRVVAGAANNQLDRDDHADELERRGILYAPDFVMNAGGVLGARDALGGEDPDDDAAHLERLAPIRATLEKVFEKARREAISSHAAAVALAKDALRSR